MSANNKELCLNEASCGIGFKTFLNVALFVAIVLKIKSFISKSRLS